MVFYTHFVQRRMKKCTNLLFQIEEYVQQQSIYMGAIVSFTEITGADNEYMC